MSSEIIHNSLSKKNSGPSTEYPGRRTAVFYFSIHFIPTSSVFCAATLLPPPAACLTSAAGLLLLQPFRPSAAAV
ncbi:hypothetical protein [Paenibacillus caui]|uniref:hypothetical protein n=1 Tax=Paenibacillus caui TaxID=2873927 RepID=UPI001CA87439|nr:hypothetical protein [Paenibacillus caui]